MIHYKEYFNKNQIERITFRSWRRWGVAQFGKNKFLFSKAFNLLLVDLSGHGYSTTESNQKLNNKISFESILNDVLEVLDKLNIKKSHFIGISLRDRYH